MALPASSKSRAFSTATGRFVCAANYAVAKMSLCQMTPVTEPIFDLSRVKAAQELSPVAAMPDFHSFK
jgi:hypothetical protein